MEANVEDVSRLNRKVKQRQVLRGTLEAKGRARLQTTSYQRADDGYRDQAAAGCLLVLVALVLMMRRAPLTVMVAMMCLTRCLLAACLVGARPRPLLSWRRLASHLLLTGRPSARSAWPTVIQIRVRLTADSGRPCQGAAGAAGRRGVARRAAMAAG